MSDFSPTFLMFPISQEVKLPYVSDVMLAYLADPSGGVTVRGVKSGEEFLSPNGNRVKIHCALANIADKLGTASLHPPLPLEFTL